MNNFQLLTLIGTIMALMAGQTTIIILYTNAKVDPLGRKLVEITSLIQHFIDISMDHGERLSTLEERTGGKPKKP